MNETKRLEYLLPLFNIDKKRELQRYCNDLVIHSNDFVALILLGQDGLLGPFLYANHFMDKVSSPRFTRDKARKCSKSCASILYTMSYSLALVSF